LDIQKMQTDINILKKQFNKIETFDNFADNEIYSGNFENFVKLIQRDNKKYIIQEIKTSKKFEGSMRQKRGRILKILLIEKGVTTARLSKELEITNKATEEVVESLIKDGLISISKNKVIVINDN